MSPSSCPNIFVRKCQQYILQMQKVLRNAHHWEITRSQRSQVNIFDRLYWKSISPLTMALKLYILALHLHAAMLFYSQWQSHQIKTCFFFFHSVLLGIFDGWHHIKEGKWNKSPTERLFFRSSLQWAEDFSYCSFNSIFFFFFQESIRQCVAALRFMSVLKLREYIRALPPSQFTPVSFPKNSSSAPVSGVGG